MKICKIGTFLFCAVCLAVTGSASAQSIRHDRMDARSARADIERLKADRKIARAEHNWGKVRQDNRLIAADRKFLHRDVRKVLRAEN